MPGLTPTNGLRAAVRACATLAVVVASLAMSACGGGSGTSFGGSTGSGDTTGASNGTGTVSTSTAGTVVLSLSSTTISASTPGTVTAQVKKADGTPIANTIVTFAVPNGVATISPASVLTDSTGSASAAVIPVAGKLGADYVTATADIPNGTALKTQAAFTVSSVTVTLGTVSAAPSNINAYGSSVINVDIAGASIAAPVTLGFSSSCASVGKATLSPSEITVTSAAANITYQDKGCGGVDRVSVSISGTSQQKQVDLTVAAPTAQSIEFVSASPDKICLKGSGCSASSVVTFRLKDQFANPVAGRDVTFDLDIPNVADLSSATAKTDVNGLANVSVSARTTPSPVRVRATVPAGAGSAVALSTVSNVLAINAGLPASRAISFSRSEFNLDGFNFDGETSAIRVQLNDRFGNPVPDGTSVSFVTEGSAVIPARCVTTDGVCNVNFVSSEFRPANGRVSVVAYAQGEESFDDVNGDNVFNTGETFSDLGEVFVDKNEDGALQLGSGEYVIGDPANGRWDGNTFVRASRVFVLSVSGAQPRFTTVDASGFCTNTPFTGVQLLPRPGVASCRTSAQICVRDANALADALGGNPVPSGSTVTVTTTAKGVSISVDNSPVPNTLSPTVHTIVASLTDCAIALTSPGVIDLSVQMPATSGAGTKYTRPIGTVE